MLFRSNNASYAEVPNSENKGNDGKIEVYSLDSPISPYAIILFYLAMFFNFVSMIHSMELWRFGSEYESMIKFCNYVPEWLDILGSAVICVIFAYGLYAGMKKFPDPMTNLLKVNIVFYIILGILGTFVYLLSLQDNNFVVALVLLVGLFGIVVSVKISIKFINNYRNNLQRYGWYLILFIVGEPILDFILTFMEPGSTSCIVIPLIIFGIDYLYFKILYDLFY